MLEEDRNMPLYTFASTRTSIYPERVDRLYRPVQIDAGRYQVTVARKNNDLYEVSPSGLLLHTTGCFKYTYINRGTLVMQQRGGYTFGTLYFAD